MITATPLVIVQLCIRMYVYFECKYNLGVETTDLIMTEEESSFGK